jgi:hypothetical protein
MTLGRLDSWVVIRPQPVIAYKAYA